MLYAKYNIILSLSLLIKYIKNYIYTYILDVSSLYTSIDIDEGLTIVQEELKKTYQSKPRPKTLLCLLDKGLILSNFTFNGEHYIQIQGTATGTGVAPNFANVNLGRLEYKFVY